MNCEHAVDLVVDSLVDALDAETERRLEDHLQSCPSCAAEAAALRRLWADAGAVTSPPLSHAAAVQFGRRLAARRVTRWTPVLRAAAAVALVAAGAALGRFAAPSSDNGVAAIPAAEGSPFLLLIRGTEPNRRAPEAQLVAEYGAWAGRLREAGRLIAAERLADDGGRWLEGVGDTTELTGFFLVRATDYEDAVRVARASPHIAYGGTIEVRAVHTN